MLIISRYSDKKPAGYCGLMTNVIAITGNRFSRHRGKMRSFILIVLAVGLLAGLASATILLGTVVSTLGLAFLAMVSIIALVLAAAGDKARYPDDIS